MSPLTGSKKPKKPAPAPTPEPEPTPAPPTRTLGSYGNASIDQWDEAFVAGSDAVKRKRGVRVDPHFMKGVMDVETGGNGNYPADRCRPSDGTDSVPACGPMQIKYPYHKGRCPECDFKTVPGQIELATHIIGMTMKERGKDEYDALITTYFPGGDINGTTQAMYVNRVRQLVKQMTGGTTPAPAPPPQTTDLLRLIFGGNYTVSQEWAAYGGPDLYGYGQGHGLDGRQHTGVDAVDADGPRAVLYAPFAGTIVCAATGWGDGSWDSGCSAFNDYSDGQGAGRVEILHPDGKRSLILGHCDATRVKPGQRVKQGEAVATEGSMHGWHCHIEAREYVGGNAVYMIRDPRKLFADVTGGLPDDYVVAFEVPQPDELKRFVTVATTRTTAVRQRASEDAPRVASDIPKGDTFETAQIQLGDDGGWWFIGRYLRGRVRVEDTDYEDVFPEMTPWRHVNELHMEEHICVLVDELQERCDDLEQELSCQQTQIDELVALVRELEERTPS